MSITYSEEKNSEFGLGTELIVAELVAAVEVLSVSIVNCLEYVRYGFEQRAVAKVRGAWLVAVENVLCIWHSACTVIC